MDHSRRHDKLESEAKKLTTQGKINMQKFKFICIGFLHPPFLPLHVRKSLGKERAYYGCLHTLSFITPEKY